MRKILIALLFSFIAFSGINAQSYYQLFTGGATSNSSYELSNGLVGIGTTITPQSQLTVQTKGSPAKYALEVQNLSAYGAIAIGSTNIPSFIIERTGTYVSPSDGDFTPINFSGTDFIVSGLGYTGIGTSTPQAKLHLYSTWIADPVLWAGTNNNTPPALFIDGLGYTSIGTQLANAQLTVMPLNKGDDIIWTSIYNPDPTVENPAFVVDANGNVGIGTGTPTTPLEVYGGDALFHNSIGISQDATVFGTTYTTNFTMPTGAAGGYILQTNAYGSASWVSPSSLSSSLWTASGADIYNNNSGIVNIVGKLEIGTVPAITTGSKLDTAYMLYVQKGIITEKVKVALTSAGNWSDYVFDANYKLAPLSEIESYIKDNKHLPGVPSADEICDQGIDMADMDATLLKKIEELTLYVLELKKENQEIKKQLSNKQ